MKDDGELSTYLARSTRGLRRRQRQAVTSELIGHIEARVQDFKLGGLSDAEALHQTLRELGGPEYVQRGMQRVYVWPSAMRTGGFMAALMCGTVFVALQLSSVLAQVQGYKPTFTPLPGPYTYVDTQSLRDELQKAGVTVSGDLEQPILTLPGSRVPIRVDTTQNALPDFVNRSIVRDYPTGRSFIDLNAVVEAAIAAKQPARVDGWMNPKLHLGNVTLTLGTPDQPLEAYNLYNVALSPLAAQLGTGGARSSRTDDLDVFSHHQLTAPAGADPQQVYALVSVQRLSQIWGRGTAPMLYFDLAQANAQGKLNFRMPYDLASLQLTAGAAKLKADADWLRRAARLTDYGSAGHPAHAMLLKLTGNLAQDSYQTVPLEQPSEGEQY